MRVVLKYYLNNPLQFLFNEKPKYWAQKITYKLTGAPSGQILNYIELEVENQNI